MRVLVTWGTKMHGTEGIARTIANQLREDGFTVDAIAASQAANVDYYDGVIIGGAIYANRWHKDARRFVMRNTEALRGVPVWFFSSGPLDASAEKTDIPPTRMVDTLMDRVGAQGHMTFGGRMPEDATGFPAKAMAKKRAGDWRNPEHIRNWASYVGRELPHVHPARNIDYWAHSPWPMVGHGVTGWAICAAIMGVLLAATTTTVALWVHAIAVPLVFILVSRNYFNGRGALDPFVVAASFVGITIGLDLVVVAWLLEGSLSMFASILGTWLPFSLIFAATWATGMIMSMMPPDSAHKHKPAGHPPVGALTTQP